MSDMGKDEREFPDFSWSNSRKEQFDHCKRAYYYEYYAYHKGWKDKPPTREAWEAYILKNAISLRIAFADCVQKAIKHYFEKKDEVAANKFMNIIRSGLHDTCVAASKKEKCKSDPKNNRMIIETINYSGGFKNEQVKKTVMELKKQMPVVRKNFLASITAQEIGQGAEVVENFADFPHGAFQISTQEKEKLTIWGRPDTVHKVDGKMVATLWQTGAKERNEKAERFHAFVVAIYLCKRYKLKAKDVEVRMCDLIAGETRSYVMTSMEQYIAVLRNIGASVSKMAQFVENGDVKQNKALPIDMFPQKADHRDCRQCPFCQMCVREAAKQKEAAQKVEAQATTEPAVEEPIFKKAA